LLFEAEMISHTVEVGQALDAIPGFLIADHSKRLAVLVRRARYSGHALASRTPEALVAVHVLQAIHTHTDGLVADPLGTILGGLASLRCNADPFHAGLP